MLKPYTISTWLDAEAKTKIFKRSDSQAIFILIVQIFVYVACMIVALANFNVMVNIIASVYLGLVIGQIFVIGHDACHQSLAKSSRLNKVIGRIAFFFSLHSYTLWHLEHNVKHHGSTNLIDKDPSWSPLSKADFEKLSLLRQMLERVYRSPLGAGIYYFFEMWLKIHSFPIKTEVRSEWRKYWLDSLIVAISLITQPCLILILGKYIAPEKEPLEILMLGWIIPFLVWNWLMGFAIYLHHTHPAIPWFIENDKAPFDQLQTRVTIHVVFPKILGLLFFNIMEHTVHHLQPSISMKSLAFAQERLEKTYGESILTYRWSLKEYLRITRICKLFDPEKRCWTDFDGHPTSAPIP
jgi:omega-6 fatty acid desaturase (delta-12 desaturase)